MTFNVVVRALLLLEKDSTENMRKWFTFLGFTNTHYKGKSYDGISRTNVDVYHKDNPIKPKYSVVSTDFDNNNVTLFNHKEGKYKKLPFSSLNLRPDTRLVSLE